MGVREETKDMKPDKYLLSIGSTVRHRSRESFRGRS